MRAVAFLRRAGAALSGMDRYSFGILAAGHAVVTAYLAGILAYIWTARESGDGMAAMTAWDAAVRMLDPVLAGLCVVWGGAALMDYLRKQ